MAKNWNRYINPKNIKAVEAFNKQLETFAKETGEKEATLYEDANTSFTLSDLHVTNGKLCYLFDGKPEEDPVVLQDEVNGRIYEDELYGIQDSLAFWKKCLSRAKRYWSMSSEKLDKIQDGEIEDEEDEED